MSHCHWHEGKPETTVPRPYWLKYPQHSNVKNAERAIRDIKHVQR